MAVRQDVPGVHHIPARDVEALASQWPCSGLPEGRALRYDIDQDGSLVDISDWTRGDYVDGRAVLALIEDHQDELHNTPTEEEAASC